VEIKRQINRKQQTERQEGERREEEIKGERYKERLSYGFTVLSYVHVAYRVYLLITHEQIHTFS
jgi:hypothetical protein